MISDVVLVRYRALVSTFHAANGAVADADRRLNDARGALWRAKEERKRQADVRFAQPSRHAEHVELLRQLDGEIAEAEATVARLAAEHEGLEARRNDANANASRARDYLMEHHGLTRAALEY